jgi:hypothetical protein
MKRPIYFILLIPIILFLSAAIVESVISFADDIIYSSWLGVAGWWRNSKNNNSEIKFNQDGTFIEYDGGVQVGFGIFNADGHFIVLHYDPSACQDGTRSSCVIRMRFNTYNKTLILEDGESRVLFRKVEGP